MKERLTAIRSDDAGMALIEVLMSAFLLLTVATGVFLTFDATTRATSEERHRARANSLAEADLERLRSMRVVELATLNQTRTVTQDGTVYTIVSRSQFLNEPATTNTCATGNDSRDYLKISSTVTWPTIGTRPAVTATSLVSPPSGSVVPNTGSLLVSVNNASGGGVSGVALTGSGAGSFNGTTNANGCVLWRNLPAGSYSMSIGGTASGMIDPSGAAPAPKAVSVVSGGTNTVALEYDRPGALSVTFKTEPYGNGTPINSNADSISVFNTGMTQPRYFVPPGAAGTKAATITTTSTLYPFASPYSVFAGTCSANNPDPTGSGANPLAIGTPTVPAGGTSPVATITLPALHLTVRTGNSGTLGSTIAGARVRVTDLNCSPTESYRRTFFTNASKQLADSAAGPANPGLPYSTRYKVCADAVIGTAPRRFNYVRSGSSIADVPLTSATAGTVRTIYLGTGATGIQTGSCP